MTDTPLAIVTGASRRLGRSFALNLARHGYAVLLHYHQSEGPAQETLNEIKSLNVPVYTYKADLSSLKAVRKLSNFAEGLPHPIEVLINSAAVILKQDVKSTSQSAWDQVINVNLRAPFFLSQMTAEIMNPGGSIINISDVGARKLWTKFPVYVISKSALETLTGILAKTYAPKIRVNAIALGLVLQSDIVTSEEWERLVKKSPNGTPVPLTDIDSALEYILKNKSVTGQTIVVDGGYSLL